MTWKASALGLLALAAGLASWWMMSPHYQRLPDFSLPDLSGELRTAREWRGEVLVLNFWATWCKPCRKEIPMLASVQEEFAQRGLQIVGVAIDKPAPVRRFSEQFEIRYPVLVDALGAARLQDDLGGGQGIPYTVVVDPRGRVRHTVAGALEREQLIDMITPLLPIRPRSGL